MHADGFDRDAGNRDKRIRHAVSRTVEEARVNMRMPGELLDAVKAAADAAGMPYQRFIRLTLERAVAPPRKRAAAPRRRGLR